MQEIFTTDIAKSLEMCAVVRKELTVLYISYSFPTQCVIANSVDPDQTAWSKLI